ncbi:MAG: hypothetical protein ACLRQF_24860 [Thomasclavelia ramosa]
MFLQREQNWSVTSIYDNTRHDILNIDHNGKNVAIPYVVHLLKMLM